MAAGETERPPAAGSAPPLAWPLLARLPSQLAALSEPGAWRELLKQAHEELKERFFAEEPVEDLVHARAALIDAVLREAWRQHCSAFADWALVAVGGYGRGELHPASDIDILLLVPQAARRHRQRRGRAPGHLPVGHRPGGRAQRAHRRRMRRGERRRRERHDDAASRRACWPAAPSCSPRCAAALAPERIWPVKQFFEAKVREQTERHLKANDTAYNLEPNVKTGPGGLRDIQTIAWVAKRHFGAETLDEPGDPRLPHRRRNCAA